MTERRCKIDGCSGIAGLPGTARGLCRPHYTELLRGRGRQCSAADCGAAARTKGLCTKHYSRQLRHGHIEETRAWYDAGQTCSVDGCSLAVRGRGWCQPHYMRFYRDGDVTPDVPLVGSPHPDDAVRFWEKVEKTDSCWRWTGALNNGRGVCRYEGRSRTAYIVAYELLEGPVPAGKQLGSTCGVNLCVRPSHRYPGTHAEIMQLWVSRRTHCVNGHQYPDEPSFGRDGSRRCLPCERLVVSARHRIQGDRTQSERVRSDEVMRRNGWICQLCDEPIDPAIRHPHRMSASVDHVVPLSKGGLHRYENCQASHLGCNCSKGARMAGKVSAA